MNALVIGTSAALIVVPLVWTPTFAMLSSVVALLNGLPL